jgi:hypothetical protein
MVSHILDKITLELENSYFRPSQYYDFKYRDTHDHVLFGIDLGHYKQYLEYNGINIPLILTLLLEDIEVRGGDGLPAYVRFALSSTTKCDSSRRLFKALA